jgi:hypothetical protein
MSKYFGGESLDTASVTPCCFTLTSPVFVFDITRFDISGILYTILFAPFEDHITESVGSCSNAIASRCDGVDSSPALNNLHTAAHQTINSEPVPINNILEELIRLSGCFLREVCLIREAAVVIVF